MSLNLPPLHQDLTWVTPLSDERAARLVAFLVEDAPAMVLDVGCGWAELLQRVLVATPMARGTGLDTDEESIAHARTLAAERGLSARLDLEVAHGRTATGPVDALICIGSSQVWGSPVEDAQPLDYAAALTALRDLTATGGRLVYGEAIWSCPPTDAAVAPLAGRHDEFVALPDLVSLAVGHGFAPVAIAEAGLDEWDVFESGFAAGYARWLAAHEADHPDTVRVLELAAAQRAAYLSGYRGVLGLAYLSLLAV